MSIFRLLGFSNDKVANISSGKTNKKLFKFKKPLILEYVLTFLRLSFNNIWIKENDFLKYSI